MHLRLVAALATLAFVLGPLGFVFFAPHHIFSSPSFPHSGRQALQFAQLLGFVLLSMAVLAGIALALSFRASHTTAEQGVKSLLRRRGILSYQEKRPA